MEVAIGADACAAELRAPVPSSRNPEVPITATRRTATV
jgi:hypothetical protein